MKTVNFKGTECVLMKSKYQVNDSLALVLLNKETGEMQLTVTVYVEGAKCYNLGNDVAVVKTYSENEGILQALSEANVVVDVIGNVPVGFTICPIVKFDVSEVEELV